MGSKSKSAPSGAPTTPVLLPGFVVTGTICIPQHPPHALWWAAYAAALLRGGTLESLRSAPPWPMPADPLLQRQLLHEMLEHRWLQLDWASGALRVREDLEACFRRDGERGLAELLQAVRTIQGEWWMDAVSGTFLRRKTAAMFDYDFGPLRWDAIRVEPRLDRIEDFDLADLLGKLRLDPDERRKARLQGELQLTEPKQLQFYAYGEKVRVLPVELAALVPGLSCHAPQVLSPPSGRTAAASRAPAAAPARKTAAPVPQRKALPLRPCAPPPAPVGASPDPLIAEVMAGLVPIPAGTFRMGSNGAPEERPCHRVTISRPFLLGRFPVTQALWERVTRRLPDLASSERNPLFPIIYVGYRDIGDFLRFLNALPGGGGFALPSEAEWEYACRAGSDGDYCFGNDRRLLGEHAWHKWNSDRMHEVGQRRPNSFGLYDMHGLVYETVRDGQRPYGAEPVTDPLGPVDGSSAGARGGAWCIDPGRGHFRCASRQHHQRTHRVSFRLARYLEPRP